MDALKELKKVLEEQIEEITKKNDISPTELERLDKAVDIIKDIETICAMRDYGAPEEEDYGYSGRYPYYMRDDMPRTGRSYDPWDRGASYRRGRDMNTGRYVSREMPRYYMDDRSYGHDGYSGHANKEDLKMDLRMMMDNAKTDKERMAIQNLLDQWKE